MAVEIDTIVLRGVAASRPAAADALLYYATDTRVISISDGSTWADLVSLGTTGVYVSATDRLLGRDSSGAGLAEEITPANVRALLDLEPGTDVQAFMASASQGEMEAGTEAALRAMSPLRVAQAIAALAPGGSSGLIGFKADTSGNHSISSATMGDVDATNAAVTFTVPASGSVMVRLTAYCGPTSTANAGMSWGLRESTSDIAGGTGVFVKRQGGSGNENLGSVSAVYVLTGLTPSASLTYKWAAAQSTGTGTIFATAGFPAVMEVWALP